MESLFTLFLLSGVFKAFTLLFGITFPIDLTFLLALFTVIALLVRNLNFRTHSLYLHVGRKKTSFFFLILWLWMLCTLMYTTSPQYSFEKTFLFLTNFVPLIVIFVSREFNVQLFLRSFSIVTLLLTILYLPFLDMYLEFGSNDEIHESVGGLYLTLGGYLGAIVVSFLTTKKNVFNSYIDKILIAISAFILLIIGARGPLIFTVLCVILYLINKRKISFTTFSICKYLIVTVGLVLFIIFMENSEDRGMFTTLYERSTERLSLIVEGVLGDGDMGKSANTRVEHFENSYNLITESIGNFIFGTGIGSFSIETMGVDGRGYPHNIILEVWTELGIIGVILLISFFVSLFWRFSVERLYISGYVVLYFLLGYSKSSSLVDLRVGVTFCLLFICSVNMVYKKYSF